MKVSFIIPTLNAQDTIMEILKILTEEFKFEKEIIILDSQSEDNTVSIAKKHGAKVVEIKRSKFNHGGTRNLAINMASGNILVYLTQHAIPNGKDDITNLVKPLSNEKIGMSYGRQIPHLNAKIFGSFARYQNYSGKSETRSMKDKDKYGIKTVFCSNSFAAYKKEVLQEVGGFPTDIILGEDTYVCAKMLLKEYSVAYVADAIVRHSHDYTIIQEFKRNFDIGVFHTNEKWLLDNFSKAEGEGLKFVVSEIKYLFQQKKGYLTLLAVIRNFSKLLGYKLGKYERILPVKMKHKFSMYKVYWSSK